MKLLRLKLFTLLLILSAAVYGQNLTQTLRGTVIDGNTKTQLFGANIMVVGTDPVQGASSDIDGNFSIENVAIGRISIQVSAIGYETRMLYNIIIESAREAVLTVEMTESFTMLDELTVRPEKENGASINDMTLVSSKTVTVEETGRYAGSLNDPARMVSAFAGVSGNAEGDNEIVVRGNSPRGFLWRLEGIEIPNPNHFAQVGSSGGPVNTLNASMLANSDFFSGAFSPEYGNAISGVFDTKFRIGNNQKREYSLSLGVLGAEATLEGPFSENYSGSYLINYRYSALDLLDAAGLIDFGGIPKYQDLSFKVQLPTKNKGVFTLFGLGGLSSILDVESDEETDVIYSKSTLNANMGVVGLKHLYPINDNMYLGSYVSVSTSGNIYNESISDSVSGKFFEGYNHDFSETNFRFSTSLNNRINRRNTINTGIILTMLKSEMFGQSNYTNTEKITWINTDNNSAMIRAYSSWKHRFSETITMVNGIHYTQLMLNNNFAIEPRVALKWQCNTNDFITMAMGLHSKVESNSVYMATTDQTTGEQANRNLELMKAFHAVVGIEHHFNENLMLKSEVYYQYLYDVPVENNPNSSFSILNFSNGFIDIPLVNEGTGKNYGLELTLERYYARNFYFMLTGSLFQSKYTAMDEIERDTRFNTNYATNLVAGKEFKLSSAKKNKSIAVNVKTSFLGANRYTPIDLEQSILAGNTVYDESNVLSEKGEDFFYLNLGVTYIINGKKMTQKLKLDIQNLTNNQAVVGEYYNARLQVIEPAYQLALIPNIAYTIMF